MNKENKTEWIIVRVTPSEKKLLLLQAEKMSVNISKYIRIILGLSE